jgi:DNA-binding beta-propeller fold protein YncE
MTGKNTALHVVALMFVMVAAIVTIIIIVGVFFRTQSSIVNGISSSYSKEPSSLKEVPSQSFFRLVQTIPIPNVNGRIDHMDIDVKGQKLFVAEIENNSLDIIDLKASKRINSIGNGLLNEPQGVIYIPELNKIFVSNGQDGSVDIFDAKSFGFIKKIKLPSDDADNIRYDSSNKLVYVGYGEGALGIINVTNGNIVGNIQVGAHPESFQIEKEKEEQQNESSSVQQRIFVNVPTYDSKVVVIESKKKHMVPTTTWPIINAYGNFPMALDQVDHRLFVGTREPPKLMVFDTNSGKVVSILDIAKDPDDIFYDAAKKRVYVSCGEGFINIFQQQQDSDHYNPIGGIATASGARTSLFVPELNRIYVAVPHTGNQQSEILVYQIVA